MPGPLTGVRIVELAGIGPGPFAGMVLADLGAEVVRVERLAPTAVVGVDPEKDPLHRGRRSIAVDVKQPQGREIVLALTDRADALIEGFRPGVMERLGLGPDVVRARNPRLVYGRITGWGQDGPLASAAGHDIDYIALTGALAAIGPADRPVPPLNLVGDFGGGGMLLALGVVAGLFEAARSGQGQVVDAAMVDGASLLMTMIYGMRAAGVWKAGREANLLDGGAPFYGTYECAGGGHVAVGAIEPQFYAELLDILGLPAADLPAQLDQSGWSEVRVRVAERFRSRSRDEWAEAFAGSDACVAPVLDLDEAPAHPHVAARGTFVEIDGVVQPAPAPRFERTVPAARGVRRHGADGRAILSELGFTDVQMAQAEACGAVALPAEDVEDDMTERAMAWAGPRADR